eukprot:GEMP01011924.1.p1 GENE.GEMP01011924.1~~GEMP01011924.1.p1  ORF type:complete len:454 (+),score=86.00 GEMP01011924.1:88-1362(+)
MTALPSDWAPQRIEYFDTHWYEAALQRVNLVDGTVDIAFAEDVWEPRTVKLSDVRSVPAKETTRPDPPLEVGDHAEVQLSVCGSPPHWEAVEVRKVKDAFYYVYLLSSATVVIVEDTQVRHIVENLPSLASMMENVQRSVVAVPLILNSWITSNNAQGCFDQICSQSRLMSITTNPDVAGELILHGDEEAIRKAKMRLDIHLEHQARIHIYQEDRLAKLAELTYMQEQFEQMESLAHEEIEIPVEYVPKVLGNQGSNLRRLEEEYDAQVRILQEYVGHQSPGGHELRRVRVSAETRAQVLQVLEEIEFTEVTIPVPSDQFGYLLGKNGEYIQDIQHKSGVMVARLQRDKEQLLLYGTGQTVEAAKDAVEAHLLYHPIFMQISEEKVAMRNAMNEMTGNSYFDQPKKRTEKSEKGKGQPTKKIAR